MEVGEGGGGAAGFGVGGIEGEGGGEFGSGEVDAAGAAIKEAEMAVESAGDGALFASAEGVAHFSDGRGPILRAGGLKAEDFEAQSFFVARVGGVEGEAGGNYEAADGFVELIAVGWRGGLVGLRVIFFRVVRFRVIRFCIVGLGGLRVGRRGRGLGALLD